MKQTKKNHWYSTSKNTLTLRQMLSEVGGNQERVLNHAAPRANGKGKVERDRE